MYVQSLTKHVNDIVYGYRCLNNYFIAFTEFQTRLSDSTSITEDTMKDSKMNFNNNDLSF